MMSGWVVLISLLYAAMLFAVAWVGDRTPIYRKTPWLRTVVYSLALAVYCTSWTFYGAVGTAARYGLGYLPIYLGPLLLMLLGWRMLQRLALVARAQSTVSIADFIGSRFGRSQRLAAWVSLIALVAAVPYLALQYKAVAISLEILTGTATSAQAIHDPALYVAAIMALFAILFGTRQVDATEHRPGLMLAVAFESVIKLLALVAVGLFAMHWLGQQGVNWVQASASLVQQAPPVGFAGQTVLAFVAMVCLPRQFHVAIVECVDVADIPRSRWWFGGYLVVVSAMVLPIAAAGLALFGLQGQFVPDSFVLALPLSQNQQWLALLAYIGGFSAATGMVIVVSVALSNMVSNDLVMPLLLRRTALRHDAPGHSMGSRIDSLGNMASTVLWVRRVAIVLLALLAYSYSRNMESSTELAALGLMSFVAVAQFAPALLAGLYWRGVSRKGVEAGLLAGFAIWAYTLLLPELAAAGIIGGDWVQRGLFGQAWLHPHALLGLQGMDRLSHDTFWSLLVNVMTVLLVSIVRPPGLSEQLQADAFLNPSAQRHATPHAPPLPSHLRVGDLEALAGRIIGERTARKAFVAQAQSDQQPFRPDARANGSWMHFTELLLAGAVGAASARLVLTRALQGSGMELSAVMEVLDKAGPELRFNREILLATLENMDQAVSVVDADMRLVAWNPRYQQLFQYPAGMLYVGRAVEELIRYNLESGHISPHMAPTGTDTDANPANANPPQPADVQQEVTKRIAFMKAGSAYVYERSLPDGQVIQLRGHPLPGGGYVTSYSDITAFRRAEQELRDINETLEQRVAERTAEAELAHESRTRFLTAISHDVLQPVHAARLFASALCESQHPAEMQHLAARVDAALRSAEELLDGILDISRLNTGVLKPQISTFDIAPLLAQLHQQYTPMAEKRGLVIRLHNHSVGVRSDPTLLRRVLQNFLANALRYTRRGRIVLAARPRGNQLLLQVWDTGSGIPPDHLRQIYDEFHRYEQDFDWDGRGLGLGLSICQRIALLLEHPLVAHSRVGHGSVFAISVPIAALACATPPDSPELPVAMPTAPSSGPSVLQGLRVLCLDNDPDILAGMQALLPRWGVELLCASTVDGALQSMARQPTPTVVLTDYHLHDRLSGLQALQLLRQQHPHIATALLTADGSDSLREEAQAQGCKVLTKPLKPASLRAFLTSVATAQTRIMPP